MRRLTLAVLTAALAGSPYTLAAAAVPAKADALAQVPLFFEPVSKSPAGVRFVARRSDFAAGITRQGPLLRVQNGSGQEAVVSLTFPGSPGCRALEGTDPTQGVSNYFRGRDPRGWRTGVAHFSRVSCRAAYPGVDLVYYGAGKRLEYDFRVRPGANPGRIRMHYRGADRIRIDAQGDLVIATAAGEIVQRRPVAWQQAAAGRRDVSVRYVRSGCARDWPRTRNLRPRVAARHRSRDRVRHLPGRRRQRNRGGRRRRCGGEYVCRRQHDGGGLPGNSGHSEFEAFRSQGCVCRQAQPNRNGSVVFDFHRREFGLRIFRRQRHGPRRRCGGKRICDRVNNRNGFSGYRRRLADHWPQFCAEARPYGEPVDLLDLYLAARGFLFPERGRGPARYRLYRRQHRVGDGLRYAGRVSARLRRRNQRWDAARVGCRRFARLVRHVARRHRHRWYRPPCRRSQGQHRSGRLLLIAELPCSGRGEEHPIKARWERL